MGWEEKEEREEGVDLEGDEGEGEEQGEHEDED